MGNPYKDESLLKTRAGRARDPADDCAALKVCANAPAGDAAAFRRGLHNENPATIPEHVRGCKGLR